MAEQQVDSPAPVKKKRHGCLKGCLIFVGLFVVVIVGSALITGFRDTDANILKNYQPSDVIADIALKDTFTDKGKAMLYRTKPKFVGGEEFSDHKYSAAAHEMLHVAYHKLTDT